MNEYKTIGHLFHKYLHVKFVSPCKMKGFFIPSEEFYILVHWQDILGGSRGPFFYSYTMEVAEALVMMK